MLPSVSAEDCLFADLGVDPGDTGCQSFEATSFLLYHREFDTSVPLVLWQIATVGERNGTAAPSREGLQVLLERLADRYGPDHEVVLYEASPYWVFEPRVDRVRLAEVGEAKLDGMTTLFVPPNRAPRMDPEMFDRLGIGRD
jgi:hypothetical protein